MEIKSFCSLDNDVYIMNKQASDTGTFFPKQTCLIKYFYLEHIKKSQINNKKTKISIKFFIEDLNTRFSKI